jgi:hypothetical protein
MGQVRVPLRTLTLADPHLDDQIIHRPPQASFARQKPRTPLSGNLYPGLELLPLNGSSAETARLEPIPIYPYCAENSVLQGGDAERGERSSP